MTAGNMVNFDYLLKYIIIGDAAVGKSNLLLRYVHGQFKPEYQLTIGVEFGAKNINISSKIFRIQIWDTAGQENFRSITRAYYKNSVCALVVYDISSRDSFNNVTSWIEDCKNQSPKTIFMVLVGNKCDLEDKRQVTYEEGKELADKNEMMFFESSAKDGINVEEIFENSAKEIAKKIEQGYYDLESDASGIKKGINRSNVQQIQLGGQLDNQNRGSGNGNGCC
jgi:small GTP-binding protein